MVSALPEIPHRSLVALPLPRTVTPMNAASRRTAKIVALHVVGLGRGAAATVVVLVFAWPGVLTTLLASVMAVLLTVLTLRRWRHITTTTASPDVQQIIDDICALSRLHPITVVSDVAAKMASFQAYDDVIHLSPEWEVLEAASPDAACAVVLHELGHRHQYYRPFIIPTLFVRMLAVYLVVLTLVDASSPHQALVVVPAAVLAWIVFLLLERVAMRALERDADDFVKVHGYGPVLAGWITSSLPEKRALAARLLATHPSPSSRVTMLQETPVSSSYL
jgi:hypothetical protein